MMASHQMVRLAPKTPPLNQREERKSRNRYRPALISTSRNNAIKRLPMPASVNSRCTCSGVSMISLSLGTMISTYWLEKRQTHWRRLEHLLDQMKSSGLRSLTRLELQELGLLYPHEAAHLSALREDPTGKSYARSLNLLLSRAHNTIRSEEHTSELQSHSFISYAVFC